MGDYRRMVDAAQNKITGWTPLYEHIVSAKVLEEIAGNKFSGLINGDAGDVNEYFKQYNHFFEDHGYDAIPFECCITNILPGTHALAGHEPGSIQNMDDFKKYPWEAIPGIFKEKFYPLFQAFQDNLPPGMKGVGGPGNGVFEIVQDLTGFEALCIIKYDDEELFSLLFQRVGETMETIWKDVIRRFGDAYCIMRFGDDLGYKTSTLLPPDDIRNQCFPAYRKIINLVHGAGKPFALHSCGCIFSVMDGLIDLGINAKHSNEDQIAPFSQWIDTYGKRIAFFGGIDTDHLCQYDEKQITELVTETCAYASTRCGFALGSGNSITDYVPPASYLAMIRAVRAFRGE
ncbi:MAG: hypothetical protein LBN21_00050 [Treponema sp.]|jgi:uroporphyrinogen decarboxylase|nr:hypothetical protein [Treponema sp.]